MLSSRAQLRPFSAAGTKPARSTVIVQVKPTKAADFRGLDNVELLQKVAALKQESFKLEYMQRTRGNTINPGAEAKPDAVAPKPHEFKHVRRQIAQLLSILRERELESGITRKQSRSLRKDAKISAGFGRF